MNVLKIAAISGIAAVVLAASLPASAAVVIKRTAIQRQGATQPINTAGVPAGATATTCQRNGVVVSTASPC